MKLGVQEHQLTQLIVHIHTNMHASGKNKHLLTCSSIDFWLVMKLYRPKNGIRDSPRGYRRFVLSKIYLKNYKGVLFISRDSSQLLCFNNKQLFMNLLSIHIIQIYGDFVKLITDNIYF